MIKSEKQIEETTDYDKESLRKTKKSGGVVMENSAEEEKKDRVDDVRN